MGLGWKVCNTRNNYADLISYKTTRNKKNLAWILFFSCIFDIIYAYLHVYTSANKVLQNKNIIISHIDDILNQEIFHKNS